MRGGGGAAARATAGAPPVSVSGGGDGAITSGLLAGAGVTAGAGANGGACVCGGVATTSAAGTGVVLARDGLVVEQAAKHRVPASRQAATQVPELHVGRIYTSTNMKISMYINILSAFEAVIRAPTGAFSVDDFDTAARTAPRNPCSVMSGRAKPRT